MAALVGADVMCPINIIVPFMAPGYNGLDKSSPYSLRKGLNSTITFAPHTSFKYIINGSANASSGNYILYF